MRKRKRDNIERLANGRYRARYFAGYDAQGKRICPSATFDSQSDAKDWLAEQRPTRTGSAAGFTMTVSQLMDKWLASKHEIRDSSRGTYVDSIELHIKPYLGHMRIRKLSSLDIKGWQAELLAQGKSNSTVTAARNRLYSAFESAVEALLLTNNQVAKVKGVGEEQKKEARHIARGAEHDRFLRACNASPYGCFFKLLIATGLRFGEAAGLTWADIDLTGPQGSLYVRRAVVRVPGGGWKWSDPKTEASTGRVYFEADFVADLVEHRRAVLEKKLKAGPQWQDHDLVFPNAIGNPISYTVLYGHFHNVLKAAGLPSTITMHKCRHFFISTLYLSGVDPKTVTRLARHKRESFTMDHYGTSDDEALKAACAKREELLRRSKG